MRQYLLYIFLLVPLFMAAQPENASFAPFTDLPSPKREIRAVWLTTIGGLDWPHSYAKNTPRSIGRQQRELCTILDQLQAAGINTVLLQTRVRATTIYPSRYEPWDGCLSGKPGVSPGYDALQFAIDECHRRGMELHAWVVTIPVGKWNGTGCSQLRKRFPKLIKKIGEDGYMNPEDGKTGDYMADFCAEIVNKYDVDGIHLDYIRYPEDWKIKVSGDRGRAYITDIVRKVSHRVKSLKPWVKMSCSPIGKADDLPRQWSHGWNAYSRVCQDAQGWLRDGLMDALFPMMYFCDHNFYPFAIDWKEQSCGRIVAPGLGIYFMSPKEKDWPLLTITQEMEILRQWGMGHTYFRSRFFTDNTKGIYDFARDEFDNCLALPDAMTWVSANAPLAPQTLEVDSLGSSLNWSGAKDMSDGPYLLYNIYSSRQWPVDISDARNLVMIHLRDDTLRVPLDGRYYAITAIDRYGNESEALQMTVRQTPLRKFVPSDGLPLFPCDGSIVTLGRTEANARDLVLIQTLQGVSMKSLFLGSRLNVGNLPEGVYQLRARGRKYSHRLGYFLIEPRCKDLN